MFIINLGVFDSLEDFKGTPNNEDYLYSKRDKCIFKYFDDNHDWVKVDTDDTIINTGITNYELGKQVVAQLPSLITDEQLAPAKKVIREYIDHYFTSQYFMLLCNDIHYYTVFKIDENEMEKAEDVIAECLQDVGVIQYIDYDAIYDQVECWVKNETGVILFLLFNYDWGVVRCQ